MKTKFDLIAEDVVNDLVSDAIPPEPDVAPGDPVSERAGQQWAADVFWVYEHIGDRVTRTKAGTSGRYAMWQYAKKNMDAFLGQLVPKAMAIDEKARDKQGDSTVVEIEEKKSIAEISRILRAAIEEAAQA